MTGILVLDKPEGMSSFQGVRKIRWVSGEKKAGHAGTLDPMATGVLPVLVGGATRFLDYLPEAGKGYDAVFQLGKRTDTLDITGTVIEEHEVHCGRAEIEAVLPQFRGEISQIPPMYSALKKDGVRLYDLARKGEEVEREARSVTIDRLELLPYDGAEDCYKISVSCSKGTYIRTLIDDIGTALGCGAVMTELRRTATCGFPLSAAKTVEEWEAIKEEGTVEEYLIPVDEALTRYPSVAVSEKQAKRFMNGGALALDRIPQFRGTMPEHDTLYRVYDREQNFLGLGTTDRSENVLAVKRLLIRR